MQLEATNIKFKQKRKSTLFRPQLKIFSLTLSDYCSLHASAFFVVELLQQKVLCAQTIFLMWCLFETSHLNPPANFLGRIVNYGMQQYRTPLPVIRPPGAICNFPSPYLSGISVRWLSWYPDKSHLLLLFKQRVRFPSNSCWSNIRHLISNMI